MTVGVGAKAYLIYGWETAFKTEATTKDKVFCAGQRLSTFTLNNSIERVYGLGNRFAEFIVDRQLTGSWGVEGFLSNPWFFRGFFNSVSTVDNLDGSYTHTFEFSGTGLPESMTIEVGLSDINVVRKLLGAIISEISVSCDAGGIAGVSISGLYADESLSSTPASSPATETENPFTFAQGTITLGGNPVAEVQRIDLSMSNAAEMIFGLGSRKASSYVDKAIEVRGTMVVRMTDSSFLELLYGSSGATSPQESVSEVTGLELLFDNGKTGADKRSVKVILTGLKFENISTTFSAEDIINQNLPFQARQVKVEATNNQATPL